jgi:hypothetical protein
MISAMLLPPPSTKHGQCAQWGISQNAGHMPQT